MKGGEDLYLMGNAKEALHCVQDLESAHDELTPSLGVLAILTENQETTWYVSVDTSLLDRAEAALVVEFLSDRGSKSEQSREVLNEHGIVLLSSRGGLDHIMNDLEALGESQTSLRGKIELN